jgi:hypothetical protein
LDDSIAIQSWGVDIHEMQRVAITGSNPQAFNEGLTAPGKEHEILAQHSSVLIAALAPTSHSFQLCKRASY